MYIVIIDLPAFAIVSFSLSSVQHPECSYIKNTTLGTDPVTLLYQILPSSPI